MASSPSWGNLRVRRMWLPEGFPNMLREVNSEGEMSSCVARMLRISLPSRWASWENSLIRVQDSDVVRSGGYSLLGVKPWAWSV